MPEGDTVARAAATLHQWLAGRTISATHAPRQPGVAAALVGEQIVTVEARGKNLFMRFASGRALHTHLKMTGSWHVYRAGEAWRRPRRQARLVLTADDRVAVAFNVPVIELLSQLDEVTHPGLRNLGPDVLADGYDPAVVVARARAQDPQTPLGDVLLDQSVLAGVGNIWRCETLFLVGEHPQTTLAEVTDDVLRRAFTVASELLRASAADRRPPPWVYRRRDRPCRRCGTPVASATTGRDARTAYWCPRCQPRHSGD